MSVIEHRSLHSMRERNAEAVYQDTVFPWSVVAQNGWETDRDGGMSRVMFLDAGGNIRRFVFRVAFESRSAEVIGWSAREEAL